MRRLPRSPRLAPIAETAARRTVDLIVLMPLAGDEHDVGCGGLAERRGDRRAAIVDDRAQRAT